MNGVVCGWRKSGLSDVLKSTGFNRRTTVAELVLLTWLERANPFNDEVNLQWETGLPCTDVYMSERHLYPVHMTEDGELNGRSERREVGIANSISPQDNEVRENEFLLKMEFTI